jgi:hypothetical protein
MTLSELNQVTVVAKEACVAVIAHPNDRGLREQLFGALAPIISQSFVTRRNDQPAHLYGLIRQVGVLSEFLRGRIEAAYSKATVDMSEVGGIEGRAHELCRKLDELLGALRSEDK